MNRFRQAVANCIGLIVPSATRLVQQGLQPAALAAISLLTIGCFAVLSIYAGNSDEFVAPFGKLLLVYAPYLLLLSIGAGLLGFIMTAEGALRYKAILSAVAVLVWLQGNILLWDYGSLDGRNIDWMSADWRGVLDLSIWIIILALSITAYKRIGTVLVIAAIATLPIQAVNSAATIISGPAELSGADIIDIDPRARDAMFSFSSSSNVVHIVMDGFQSDIFAEIVDNYPDRNLHDELRGFTFFAEHLGVYPYTQLTMPALLSGKLYRNDIPVDDFVRSALQGNTILNAAFKAGHEVDIAAQISLANVYGIGNFSHSYGITPGDHVSAWDYTLNDAAKLIDLALFRVVPHFAKALVYRDQLWVFQGRIRAESYLQLQYFSDLAFLRQLAEKMSVNRDKPVYKMIHVMLSHRPTVGSEQCEYDGQHSLSRANVTKQARCGLLAVLDVLRRMKELGIYDESLIVLMGDHGAWVPVETLRNGEAEAADIDAMTVAMAMPVLAIKRPGDDAEFQVSTAPTSIIDIPATIDRIMNLGAEFDGVSVFEIDPDTKRTRTHLTYGYGINPKAKGFLFPMHEYSIRGSPLDATAWQQKARHVAGSIVTAESD